MAGQNTLDVYYPQVLGPQGLDPVKVQDAISRIYDSLYRIQPIDPSATNSTIMTDGFVDQLLLKLHLTSILLTHETFFASTAVCSWNPHQLNYKDQEYQIPAGNTTNKFIYWSLSAPSTYQTSATVPTLDENTYVVAQYNAAAGTVQEVWQARMRSGGTGVTVTGSGTTNNVPKFTDGANGVIGNSDIVNTSTAVIINNSKQFQLTGFLTAYNGASATDGQLLIGDGSIPQWTAATLTQGTGVTITNGHAAITIAIGQAVGTGSDVTFHNVTSNGTLTAVTYTGAGAITFGNTGGAADITINSTGNIVLNPTAFVKVGTRTAASVPANFVANFYIQLQDQATGANLFIPAMNAAW